MKQIIIAYAFLFSSYTLFSSEGNPLSSQLMNYYTVDYDTSSQQFMPTDTWQFCYNPNQYNRVTHSLLRNAQIPEPLQLLFKTHSALQKEIEEFERNGRYTIALIPKENPTDYCIQIAHSDYTTSNSLLGMQATITKNYDSFYIVEIRPANKYTTLLTRMPTSHKLILASVIGIGAYFLFSSKTSNVS